MTLSKLDINILIEIYSGKNTLVDIARSLGISMSIVSVVVSRLSNKHLCEKIREGKFLRVEISYSQLGIAFRKLVIQNKQLKFNSFLYGLKFRILSVCLYESKTTYDISKILNVSRKSVQNLITSLKNRILLKNDKGQLLFQKKIWNDLFIFLDSYRLFSLYGDVLWKIEDEILFEVRISSKGKGVLSGFSRFIEYDIPVRTIKDLYFVSKKKLTKNDIFLHCLLQIGDDTRLLEIAIVFFKKNNLRNSILLKMSSKYDSKNKMLDFISILKSKDDLIRTKTLPPVSKKGISSMIKLYEVRK